MSYERAKSIFLRASEMDSEARSAYVAEACGDDAGLRRDVEDLLRHHERLGAFLDDPESETTGTTIGPYRLLEEIGEGGFGVVYVAEQAEPVRRRVALKVIKAGMDTREVVARFEAERQALALMDHPNIARVFDGGSTPGGRPFFVMELVKGVHIHDYCDQCQMPLRERLELFVRVCRAVQHAHQKGIIHRDLKPSNVLVAVQDGEAVPKVIDFGVAKATGQRLTEATFHTRFAQMIGTPQYMSPEQAEMSALDVDTRSDVYSLGVLLYELLTGTTPLMRERLKTATFDELRRMIRNYEPPTPSARLTALNGNGAGIAAARRTELRRLTRLVHGDLDWIVMKALEKDRTRRYETASALAADIERYLADEPVDAGPPSWWYRAKKLARRNRSLLATSLVIAAAVGVVGWNLRERAARAARVERDVDMAWREAAALRKSALADADNAARWKASLGAAFSALKAAESLLAGAEGGVDPALVAKVRMLRADLESDERDRSILAELERAMVEVFLDTGIRSPDATAAWVTAGMREALARQGIDPSSGSPEQAAARIGARAESVRDALMLALIRLVAAGDTLDDAEDEWFRATLAAVADEWQSKITDALVRKDRQPLEEMARLPEMAHQPLATVLYLDSALSSLGAAGSGTELLRRAQQHDPGNYWVTSALAWSLYLAGSPEAVQYFRVSLALRPDSAGSHIMLGLALSEARDHDAAVAAQLRAIALEPDSALAHGNLSRALFDRGDCEAALAAARTAIALDEDFAEAHVNLGNALDGLGHHAEAAEAYRSAMKVDPTSPGPYTNLGAMLRRQGKIPEAIALQRKAVEVDPGNAVARLNLGSALDDAGDHAAALAEYRKAVELDPREPKAYNNLGNALRRAGDDKAGLEALRKAVELDPGYALGHHNLGVGLMHSGALDEAIAELQKALELGPGIADTHFQLGLAYYWARGLEAASPEWLRALQQMPDDPERHNFLAWTLATNADPRLRDPEWAVELAKRATDLVPQDGNLWNTRGVAHYRAGDLQGAIAAFEESMKRRAGGDAYDWIFLAMAHARLERKDEARTMYDRAVEWIEQRAPNDEELLRFRGEAAELLGIATDDK